MNTMPILVPALLLLSACAPTATDAPTVPTRAMADGNATATSASPPTQAPATSTRVEPASTRPADAPAAESKGASISGAIRNGNRAPPALRVCATPVDGSKPTCIDTAQGAHQYRLDVPPGRYYLLGWAQAGELTLIAHASQIRCIRAPCPPDELIEIALKAGEQREGIDLNGGYVDVPDGWPKRPG